MTISESETVTLSDSIVVRLLNGVMQGCEFTLTTGTTLFIVADAQSIRQQTLEEVDQDSTIFIPMEMGGINFNITVGGQASGQPQVVLNEIQDQGANALFLTSNQIVNVGSLKLAMRYQDDCWSDGVLEQPSAVKKVDISKIIEHKPRLWIVGGLVFVAILLGVLVYGYFTSQQRQMSEISLLLGKQQTGYSYILGQDHTTYIFAGNNADKNWAQQALIRTPPSSKVKVLDVLSEEARLRRWLEENWPAVKFQRVRLTQPKQPQLTLSSERGILTPQQQQALTKAVKQYLPYAERIIFSTISDRLVMDEAEQGLKKIAVPYSKINHQGSVTFVIQGTIDDNQLERVKYFVKSFEKGWGSHYIQFSIDLKNDWLKGKSFKYGNQGYVKVSPYHWYFPKPLITEESK